MNDLSRLSLNQASIEQWSVREAVEGCVRQGVPAIGLWRHSVAATGLAESAQLVRKAGLRVSSLCRGGFFPAATAADRLQRIEDNMRAVDEAVALGTDVLVLVCGPPPDRDLDGARAMVADGIAAVAPYAAEHGVRLGIEPLHPMFAGDRSVIVTLRQALDIAVRFPVAQVGVVVDVYHVWWDPEVYVQIERAGERIIGFHVSDWLAPPPSPLYGRGMLGDGTIELRRLREAVDRAGYAGPIEVEILNRDLHAVPGDEALALIAERFQAHVGRSPELHIS